MPSDTTHGEQGDQSVKSLQSCSVSKKGETPRDKEPESIRTSSRKALVTTVMAIALNPISLVPGYFINHLLRAPRLGVQYVK